MNLLESARIALRSLSANKMRATLTMLGHHHRRGGCDCPDGRRSWGTSRHRQPDQQHGHQPALRVAGQHQSGRRAFGCGLGTDPDLPGCPGVGRSAECPGHRRCGARDGHLWPGCLPGQQRQHAGPGRHRRIFDGAQLRGARGRLHQLRPTYRPNLRWSCWAPTSPTSCSRADRTRSANQCASTTSAFTVVGVLVAKGGSGFGNQDDQVLVPHHDGHGPAAAQPHRGRPDGQPDQCAGDRPGPDGGGDPADLRHSAPAPSHPLYRRLHRPQPG